MQQNNSKQSNQSEIELNFIEIVRILLNSKRLIILTAIAAGAIGWMYSIYFNPALPPNFESDSVIELGSYPATDEQLAISRDGRILVASMEATTARLDAIFGMHKSIHNRAFSYITGYDELIQKIRIHEIDSQFFTIEVVGATLDIVESKTNEIIEYVKTLHDGLLDEVTEKKNREIKNIKEKLLTIDKYINYISENDIYVSNVAELKLKEIEFKHELAELYEYSNNINNYKNTDLVGKSVYISNHPKSNIIKLVFVSFIIGFMFVSFVVLIRHALAKNYKE